MLRASANAFDHDLDVRAIADPRHDVGVPGGNELIAFVDAVFGASGADPTDARAAVLTVLGPEALVDAASVYGNFHMMNRVAEASGIGVPGAFIAAEAETVAALGLDRFHGHHRRDE